MSKFIKSVFAVAALSFFAPLVVSAEVPVIKADEQDQAELEAKLADARGRLEKAAREVAELSGQLTGPIGHDFFIANRMHGSGAMLGIGIGDRTESKDGAVVESVMPEGPASKAGIKSGDVIVAVDGKSLTQGGAPGRALVKHMRGVTPGQKVKLEYLRDGKKQTTELTAERMDTEWAMATLGPDGGPRVKMFRGRTPMAPGVPGIPAAPAVPGAPGMAMGPMAFTQFLGPDVLDMELVTLTPKLGSYFGAERGVLVVRAPSDASIKLQEGDVILSIDGREPQTGVHAMRILRSYQPGEQVKFNVLRDRKSMNLTVTVPESDHLIRRHVDGSDLMIQPKVRAFKIPPPPPSREESL